MTGLNQITMQTIYKITMNLSANRLTQSCRYCTAEHTEELNLKDFTGDKTTVPEFIGYNLDSLDHDKECVVWACEGCATEHTEEDKPFCKDCLTDFASED